MAEPTVQKKFIKGNEAIVYGALDAGCECYFAYPITPQNDIPELMSELLPERGGRFVQAESEVASANMLLGAAACGVRSCTSSSSPGVSLMQEAISYLAGSELPTVIVNMNRGGPGLGNLGPSQGDYFQSVKGGGHGDYRTLVLAPASGQECYDMMIEAFDLAFKYRNPVLVLGDATVGQMKEPVVMRGPAPRDDHGSENWFLDGAKGRAPRLLKSLFLEDNALGEHNRKLDEKYKAMQKEARAETFAVDDAELVVVAFGVIGRIAKSAVRELRGRGFKVGLVRPQTLYPFPSELLADLARKGRDIGRRFLTIEHNCGQMVEDVRLAVRRDADSAFFGYMPGDMPGTDDFIGPILEALENGDDAKEHI